MVALLQNVSEGDIVADDTVSVVAPAVAENQMEVPVTVDASKLDAVKKIVVLTDLNPIHHVLTYEPVEAAPYLSFRVKVEQATPIRAAVLTGDGKWHVSGVIVDAAGGGCTAPALAHGQDDWTSRLAEVKAKIWRYATEPEARLRMKIRHPMDTGLADGIPAFYINKLEVKGPGSDVLARLEVREPVSENPTFTMKPKLDMSARFLKIEGRDTDGNLVNVKVPAPTSTTQASLLDQ